MSAVLKTFFSYLSKAIVIFAAITVAVVLLLKWLPPPTTAFMLPWQLTATFSDQELPRREWVNYQSISPHLALAVVAAEDQKFPFHRGFDFAAMEQAYQHNRRGKSIRGASTISQQVAKNLFLWPRRSYLRKGMEAYFTFLIEAFWSKRRILEVYLNIAFMGNNVFGAEAASRRFFNKSARSLSSPEAALLAAALPSPSRFNVGHPSAAMLKRQRWILRQMKALGGTAYLNSI